jgi:hypothetical protein
MSYPISRRGFVGGALAGLGDFAFLGGLPHLSAADARVNPKVVQLSPDVEPLVRLIEETPRNKLLQAAAERVRGGTSYQQMLAALMLAGVRGIKPRPVGFKFHAVLVVHSAHLATLAAEDRDRWLPLFWALDNYKVSQAANKSEGGWMMPPVDEAKLPPAHQARARFIEAMDAWDEEGADVAVTAFGRAAGVDEVFEVLHRYGARDFRDIGHKAIYVANARRTINTIGWRHAEPILRSLAFALLEHEGDSPAKRDADADRPYRQNTERLAKIEPKWQEGKASPEAAADLLATLRTATPADAPQKVVDLLANGVSPASVWDGLFLGAGELLMRQPGIVGLHCVTTTNALHFAYQNCSDAKNRQLMMLQNAAFLTLFLKAMAGRGKVGDGKLDALKPEELETKEGERVAEVFADVSKDRTRAARKALTLLEIEDDAPREMLVAARRLIFTKGRDSHDYKFSSAVLEDFFHVTPRWRNLFLASGLFWLRGAGEPDNDLSGRARAALAKG